MKLTVVMRSNSTIQRWILNVRSRISTTPFVQRYAAAKLLIEMTKGRYFIDQ